METITDQELRLLQARIARFTDYTIGTHYRNKEEIRKIKNMQEKGIYVDRQFVDAPRGLTKREYIRWLKDSKKTFLNTIPTESLLLGGHSLRIQHRHSDDEMKTPCLNGYSPSRIIETLKSMDIYAIMLLLTTHVRKEEFFRSIYWNRGRYITGIYEDENGQETRMAAHKYLDTSSIASISECNTFLLNDNYMNLREFLFRNLGLPINVVLNSINEAINPYLLPNEGVGPVELDDELCEKIYRIRSSDEYKFFTRNQ